METGHTSGAHHFYLDDRRKGSLTGIQKVESFDDELVALVTTQGKLIIKGKDLHVIRVDVAKGELEFSGTVDSTCYQNVHAVGRGIAGVFKRMFQ